MAKEYTEYQSQFKDFKEIVRTLRNVSDLMVIRGDKIYLHSLPNNVNRIVYLNPNVSLSMYDNIIFGPNKLYEFLQKATKTGIRGERINVAVDDERTCTRLVLNDDKKEISIEIDTITQDGFDTMNESCYKHGVQWFEDRISENRFKLIGSNIMTQMYDDMAVASVILNNLEMGLCKSMFPLSDINTPIWLMPLETVESREFVPSYSEVVISKEVLPLYNLYTAMRFLVVNDIIND